MSQKIYFHYHDRRSDQSAADHPLSATFPLGQKGEALLPSCLRLAVSILATAQPQPQ